MTTATIEPERFQTYGPAVAQFGHKFIVQTKGRWASRPLDYEPWQQRFLNELLLCYPDGERVYKEALLGVARKNGKSTLSASLALYLLMGSNEQGPEVYAAAASKDQARIVFDQARDFIEASPRLRDWLEPQRSSILCKHNGGVFRVLSSDAPLQYGLNPSGVIIDELWAHKNAELYYALTTGQLAREEPLVVSITTAGFDRQSICYDRYKFGRALLAETPGSYKAMRREKFLFRWFEARAQADFHDQDSWRTANPSSWIKIEDLEREAKRLPESVFRRLHLNQWTESEEAWIKPWQWDALQGRPQINPNEPIIAMAVDVGITRDSAAILWGQWHTQKFWKNGIEQEKEILHVGHLILDTEKDKTFGVADVRGHLAQQARRFDKVVEVAYDPWQFRESAEILLESLNMQEFPQHSARMGPASETLYELVVEGRLVHDGDPELRAHILAAVTQPTDRGGWKISKRKSLERIDACVALAMLADRAVTLRFVKPSVYDRRGILSFEVESARAKRRHIVDGEEIG